MEQEARRMNLLRRFALGDAFRRNAKRFRNQTALVFPAPGGEVLRYTWDELNRTINRVANGLLSLGVGKGDKVAVYSLNCPQYLFLIYGLAKIGAAITPINVTFKEDDIRFVVNDSGAGILFIEDTFIDLMNPVLAGLPGVRPGYIGVTGLKKKPDGWIDMAELLDHASDQEPEVEIDTEDIATITYTSGTEALPKGVIISNQALMAQYMGAIVDGQYDEDDISINALPIYHCAQRDVFLNPIFWVGGTNVLIQPDIGLILKSIAEFKATLFFAPPTVWIGMLRHPEFAKQDLSSLKKCYYGASIMPMEILKEMMERLPGVRIYNYYGQTELAPYHTILKAKDALAKIGSAGLGGINMETRLEDDEGKVVAVPDVPGEICGKGPHALIMYFKEPAKTDDAMKGGWFHSGDIGIMDSDRYITVADRKKDMIKTGGENVATREVEDAVYLDKRVQEVAVIGLPDPKWVEIVTAVIVLKAGETMTAKEVMDHCRKNLAPFKCPKKVVFMDALPKTPTGKILKREMRASLKNAPG
jgi:fatty-acyl-CoA synthase